MITRYKLSEFYVCQILDCTLKSDEMIIIDIVEQCMYHTVCMFVCSKHAEEIESNSHIGAIFKVWVKS